MARLNLHETCVVDFAPRFFHLEYSRTIAGTTNGAIQCSKKAPLSSPQRQIWWSQCPLEPLIIPPLQLLEKGEGGTQSFDSGSRSLWWSLPLAYSHWESSPRRETGADAAGKPGKDWQLYVIAGPGGRSKTTLLVADPCHRRRNCSIRGSVGIQWLTIAAGILELQYTLYEVLRDKSNGNAQIPSPKFQKRPLISSPSESSGPLLMSCHGESPAHGTPRGCTEGSKSGIHCRDSASSAESYSVGAASYGKTAVSARSQLRYTASRLRTYQPKTVLWRRTGKRLPRGFSRAAKIQSENSADESSKPPVVFEQGRYARHTQRVLTTLVSSIQGFFKLRRQVGENHARARPLSTDMPHTVEVGAVPNMSYCPNALRLSAGRMLQSCSAARSSLMPKVSTSTTRIASFSASAPHCQRKTKDNNKVRGVSSLYGSGPREPLSMSSVELPKPRKFQPKIKLDPKHGLWGFFPAPGKALATPKETEEHGRAWTVEELRKKSWEDLHALWWVCLKERNMLATSKAELTRSKMGFGERELDDRDEQVMRTMRSIKHALTERYYTWQDAVGIAMTDPEINLKGKEGEVYTPSAYEDELDDVDDGWTAVEGEGGAEAVKAEVLATGEQPAKAEKEATR
ncbi:hypothetical protein G7046_g4496 [Stylonectria norvegica]|nr:hypothetical protein G7046_g4496 [Stylonectria norvegica]